MFLLLLGSVLFLSFFLIVLNPIVGQLSSGVRPPGPRPLPLIGNLLDFPKGHEGQHWAKLKQIFGPISSIKALGRTVIILNTHRVASDILDKRSSVYVNKPNLVFCGQMCGYDNTLILLRYGDRCRATRKMMHSYIGSRMAMKKLEYIVELETHRFLLRILKNPGSLLDEVRTVTGAIILKIAYGYSVETENRDDFVELVREASNQFSLAIQTPKWLVDVFPFLQYLPEWMPGMKFKRTAREWKQTLLDVVDRPYAFVKQELTSGTAVPSFTSTAIERGFEDDEEESTLKWAASMIYGGGSDTTVSAISTFFLAMVLHPSVMKRAQMEIDSAVGRDRFPTYSDRENLPYVEAVVKESLRWQTVVPMGGPRVADAEDTYEGYRIPKGAVLLANLWQMSHDEDVYHSPMEFKPERFLAEDGRPVEEDPRNIVFGFGRRLCPGKELAYTSLFLAVAMSLAVFDVEKAKDDMGRVVEPRVEYTSGGLSHPKAFPYSITPRSTAAADLIRTIG